MVEQLSAANAPFICVKDFSMKNVHKEKTTLAERKTATRHLSAVLEQRITQNNLVCNLGLLTHSFKFQHMEHVILFVW